MPILTVSDLVIVTTFDDALALELTIAAALGLPTTAWQPLSPEMSILGVNAQIVTTYSVTVNQIAQGGFSSLAAVIPGTDPLFTDTDGFATAWLNLISVNVYNVTRRPATFATGPATVVNGSATTYGSFAVGQLHWQNPLTGATYSNTDTGTAGGFIVPGSTTFTIQADASWPGGTGTAAQGTVLTLITPLPQVTVAALAAPMVGADLETNAALLLRDQAKLGALSPNGASQAYVFVATSIPTPANQAAAPVPFNRYSVTSPITRVATSEVNGVVGVYVANAAGAPSSPDIASVNAAIQALCVPLAVTATVAAVGQVPLNLVYTVYIPATFGLSAAQAIANINAAILKLCSATPIGGYTGAVANIVPFDLLVETILAANPGSVDLTLTNPSGDVSIAATSVPVPGSGTGGSVVFV